MGTERGTEPVRSGSAGRDGEAWTAERVGEGGTAADAVAARSRRRDGSPFANARFSYLSRIHRSIADPRESESAGGL